MIDSTALVAALKTQVLTLENDLRVRVVALPEVSERWRAEHRRVLAAERTASSWTEWRDDRVTQAAVAWVLTTVFVRFSEDNGLIKPVWITGPGSRRQEALDAQLAFFRGQPEATDREWVLEVVSYLRRLPSTAGLVDNHSPLWSVSPSGQAMTDLLAFWREREVDGRLRWDFADSAWSTRFLGDLYQDLSEHAKKTYALLQTPEFVEEFILDQTLEPALRERRLEGFSMIDPTCGSGHFLLGAFARLLERWGQEAPGLELQDRVQKALDAVHGVDLNPFAVAIARFRLTVAALEACGLRTLEQAPAFHYHLAAGDSLLFGRQQEALPFAGANDDEALVSMVQSSENFDQLKEILEPGQYDVVVGNPPYITVKDKVLNQAYRIRYSSCKGPYALTVPFMERFFNLAKPGLEGKRAGWVGQITSNSFMKREFGAKLVEDFLPRKDLRLLLDSEGAWIPGHNMDGTPTVIMTARNQPPSTSTVRAVLSKGKRESRDAGALGKGPYWSAMVEHLCEPGWENGWVSIVDLKREALLTHPWTLGGGAAALVMRRLSAASKREVSDVVQEVGRTTHTGSDEVFYVRSHVAVSRGFFDDVVPMVLGEDVRDYQNAPSVSVIFPYTKDGERKHLSQSAMRFLWPNRAVLRSGMDFQQTREERGLRWFDHSMFFPRRWRRSLYLAFPGVVSHNHFYVGRGGRAYSRWAPMVILPRDSSEDDHFALLGLLNSSTACFWLKQNAQPKGGAAERQWSRTYEFTGTTLKDYPLPEGLPVERGRSIADLADQLDRTSAAGLAARQVPTAEAMNVAAREYQRLRSQMVALQEELDWETYGRYGLARGDLVYGGGDLPELQLGERAFEIALARKVAAGEEQTAWFDRHGSTPITEMPTHWPAAYRDLVQRRLDLIESDSAVALLESSEYKRRWASESWESMQQRALREWLLDRLEDKQYWFNGPTPTPRSLSQLADAVVRDEDLISVLALWEGRPDVPIVQSLTKLLTDEAVPFLAAHRLKDSGLRKFEAWQETWDLQRQEDAGRDVGNIPVPPKYTNADFRKASWWQARGKLDVPKERFILYPNAGRATDSTLLLGWAGWDHAEQALALATIIGEREAEGRPDEDLVPLVAGLAELQPWVEQWHADVHPVYGQSLAVFCREQLADRSRQVNWSVEQLAAWRPPATTRGRKAKA